jgi:hypothetical protein
MRIITEKVYIIVIIICQAALAFWFNVANFLENARIQVERIAFGELEDDFCAISSSAAAAAAGDGEGKRSNNLYRPDHFALDLQ